MVSPPKFILKLNGHDVCVTKYSLSVSEGVLRDSGRISPVLAPNFQLAMMPA